jgi:hypothetical protein
MTVNEGVVVIIRGYPLVAFVVVGGSVTRHGVASDDLLHTTERAYAPPYHPAKEHTKERLERRDVHDNNHSSKTAFAASDKPAPYNVSVLSLLMPLSP